jgi:hypothetical protein
MDKAAGRLGETAGRLTGDKSLEAEGRATRRKWELKTYVVSPHADGGWKVQAEGTNRASSVHRNQSRGAGRRQGDGEEPPAEPAPGLQEGRVGGAGGADLRVDHVLALGPGSYRVPALPPFAGRRGGVGKTLDVR